MRIFKKSTFIKVTTTELLPEEPKPEAKAKSKHDKEVEAMWAHEMEEMLQDYD